ncbi:hypothetical protein [Hydrogenophaga sp.]|uniref:hypothetical protein n=1 Tax=Hydrogenophaga sp. TaxID=1904254 RepID=UPI0025BBD20A|nr:hypothetical protein [Hydrogenophaga sp.]MBT9467219.1 hypothetical protein [Hydrogenophaga sp.]
MATVPTYQGPKVRSEALQFAPQQGARSDAAFGGVQGRQLAAAGAGLADMGAGLERLQERRALEKAFEVENKIAEEYKLFEEQTLPNRQGEKAAGYRAEVEGWWQKTAETYGAELDDRTRKAVSRSLLRMRGQATGRAGSFELEQADRVGQVAFESMQAREAREAAGFGMAGNEGELATSIKKITDSTRGYLVRKGMPSDAIDEAVRTAVGKVHGDVVVGLMQTDPKRAKEYFERPGVADSFTRGQRAEIGARLAQTVDAEQGAVGARDVFGSAMKDKPYHEVVPYDELDAKLVKQFEGKPDALKAARQELDRAASLWNRRQTEEQAAGIQGAYDLLNGGKGLRQIQASPAWQRMTPQQRDQFGEMLNNRWRAAQSHALADRERAERAEELRTSDAAIAYTDPAALSRLSREEVIALRPSLGEKNYAKVSKAWQDYQKDQTKLSNATFDNDMFNEALLSAGYDPKPGGKNKEGAATVMRARNAIDTAIAAEQKIKQRELSAQEKRTVAQGVVSARVQIDRPWMPDREVGLIEADPAEVAERGYITVGPKSNVQLRVSDVPVQDFVDMKRYLRERGQPSDDITVMRRWYDFQQQQKKTR